MKFKRNKIAYALLALILIACGTTSVLASSNTKVGVVSETDAFVIGKDKEAGGQNKISFDNGQTWISEKDFYSKVDTDNVEYWTYDEYKAYTKQVERDLMKMLAASEPDLTQADIDQWIKDSAAMLEFIKNGTKLSKDNNNQIMTSTLDNSNIGTAED